MHIFSGCQLDQQFAGEGGQAVQAATEPPTDAGSAHAASQRTQLFRLRKS